jgi:hypothetical protein
MCIYHDVPCALFVLRLQRGIHRVRRGENRSGESDKCECHQNTKKGFHFILPLIKLLFPFYQPIVLSYTSYVGTIWSVDGLVNTPTDPEKVPAQSTFPPVAELIKNQHAGPDPPLPPEAQELPVLGSKVAPALDVTNVGAAVLVPVVSCHEEPAPTPFKSSILAYPGQFAVESSPSADRFG